MKISVRKSDIGGLIKAPASKSYTIRALMCAALAKGQSEIKNPLYSDDTKAASQVLSQIGVPIETQNGKWKIKGGKFQVSKSDLFCGDSAATLRFMCAVCTRVPGISRLTAGSSLQKRPIATLIDALRQWGIEISCQNNNIPPVLVNGGIFEGGLTETPGDISSQYISALLLIAPLAQRETIIRLTTPLESVPYVMMTIECLKQFGIEVKCSNSYQLFEIHPQVYKPAKYKVEADWSSSSYLFGLGALAGDLKIENLNLDSLQGDKSVVYFLKDMGAEINVAGKMISVKKKSLEAVNLDLNDCIDLLPTMAVLAALAKGTSELSGIERAKLKESNRVATVREGLERIGINVIEKPDKLIIEGGTPIPAIIDTHDDHRIAMAFSLIGVACGGIVINGAECVSKTYPEYWDTLRNLGVKLDEQ
jgi:3-phosphoshikimate 1-carboxyvinyltransferase